MKKYKAYWEKDWKYRALQDFLYDYWLTEKNELYVSIDMTFVHASGEWQRKKITWFNPNFERIRKKGEARLPTEFTKEELELENLPKTEIPYLDEIRHGKIRKKKKSD